MFRKPVSPEVYKHAPEFMNYEVSIEFIDMT